MKQFTILLICISLFAVGCAPRGGTEQSIRTIHNEEISVRLLSVRSDALIVDVLNPHSDEDTSRETNIVRFGFDTIDAFVHWTVSPSRTFALAGTSGVVLGTVIGSEIDGSHNSWQYLYSGIVGGIIGLLVGSATTGILAATGNHSYNPYNPYHLEKIVELAIYKTEEPDELKKIK